MEKVIENPDVQRLVKKIVQLEAENKRLSKRDCNATIVLSYNDGNNPFAREELEVVDIGVSDNIYVVESQIVKELFDKLKAREIENGV